MTGAPGHNAAQAILADVKPRFVEAARRMKPLAGIRVLDLSRVLAGPWATQLLADLGADVIKVEQPGRGDDTRHWGPPWHEHGDEKVAAYFLAANRGKRSVAIDFATDGRRGAGSADGGRRRRGGREFQGRRARRSSGSTPTACAPPTRG